MGEMEILSPIIYLIMSELNGTNVPSKIVPYTSNDNYATHDEEYGRGGFRSVSTVTEMNNIPSRRRKEGMLVHITSDETYYKLKNGTFVKEEFGGGSSGGDSNVKVFTTTGLFNPNRGSTVITLNTEDLGIFKSLFDGAWGNTKLYYAFDDGEYVSLVPMAIHGTFDISFEDAYAQGQPFQLGLVTPLGQVLSDEVMIINESTVQTDVQGTWVYSSQAVAVASSFSRNGYTKFVNGLLIQWGTTTGASGKSVYFPVAFANTNYAVMTTSQDTSSNLVIKNAVSTKYTTYFKLYSNYVNTNPSSGTAGSNLYWFAIGTWR